MPGTGELWFTIVNLHAGSGKTVSIWRKAEILLAKAGIPYDNKYTDCKYHATEIAFQAASEGYRKFIAVGGDGTIHEVLEGIMKYVCGTESVSVSDFSIAVIPIGSGNDWIRIHGINRNLERTIELIRNESLVRQDVVRVSVFDPVAEPEQLLSAEPVRTSYMVNIGGVGFDARVCERVNEQKLEGKKGKLLYINSLLYNLFHFKPFSATVFCDGRKLFEGGCFSIAVGTGKYSGGGLRQTPDAVFDDGLLDYTVIPPFSVARILKEAPKLFTGRLLTVKELICGKCKSLTVAPFRSRAELVEVDGEIVGNVPVRFDVLPQQINVLHA